MHGRSGLRLASAAALLTAAGGAVHAADRPEYGGDAGGQRYSTAAQVTPMTYELDGRQYVVIAAGGHAGAGTTSGDALVAFALPKAAR